jgi:periplasmic protein TonB
MNSTGVVCAIVDCDHGHRRRDLTALPYREHHRRARQARRQRALARTLVVVDSVNVADPLLRRHRERRRLPRVLFLLASLVAHSAIGLSVTLVAPQARRTRQTVNLQVIEREPVSESNPTSPPPTPAARPAPPIKAKNVPVVPAPMLPPPDPTTVEPPATPALQPRRVVGLSMESTVTGGTGAAFAVGNTRMGRTDNIAVDPNAVQPLAQEMTPPVRQTFEKPDYPPELRARGVEGEVGLELEIDATGKVVRATVLETSNYEAFDRAAVAAAQRNEYSPAKLNGVALSQTIRFKIRFRLRD